MRNIPGAKLSDSWNVQFFVRYVNAILMSDSNSNL